MTANRLQQGIIQADISLPALLLVIIAALSCCLPLLQEVDDPLRDEVLKPYVDMLIAD